jgi:hypothetical protein
VGTPTAMFTETPQGGPFDLSARWPKWHCHMVGLQLCAPCETLERPSVRYAIAALVFLSSSIPVRAQPTCDQLWYSRNAIYKDAGYCFKTSRAIRTFGNAGCQYDDVEEVPLSNRQRQEVNAIQGAERSLRCPR